ncbi:calcium-binding protein [Nocardioides euryhalodurans]|uniref:Calcium-binding protein n=1 Tax=Nocardioides euryhalodurans TaxID=2518370 RepID=A0A4P7GJK1_9ACTN|nr:hypothetical protein [Nocardioides euryhalodurans]QBR92190.1 hypothetical protein EXE57_07745 [Nocardioides euryhalodurans]
MTGSLLRRTTILAGLVAGLVLVPAATSPATATSCRFADGVATVRVDAGTAVRMFVWPGTRRLWWGNQSDSSQDGYCGRARTGNTDRVVVIGRGRTSRLDYQLPHHAFGPGRVAEARGESEIEFVLRDVTAFWMTGLGGLDGVADRVWLGERGVDVNGDGDRDVTFRGGPMTNVALFLLGGPDSADAGGGHGTGDAWPRRRSLTVTGGDGDDVLRGHAGPDSLRGDPGTDRLYGLGGRDDLSDSGIDDELWGGGGADVLTSLSGDPTWFHGGAGDDVIDALDTFVDHLVDGGPGHDRAWYDDEDPTSSIEERLVR